MTAVVLAVLGLLLLAPAGIVAPVVAVGLSVRGQWRAERPAGYRVFGGQR